MSASHEMLAWAAGFFEGEGCVTANRNGHKLTLSLVNTDLEMLERFRDVVGIGAIRAARKGVVGKEQYVWQVYGDKAVLAFNALSPWLGSRRRARFAELLAIREAYIDEVTALRQCPRCGTAFRPTFTVSSRRRRFCSSACKATYGSQQHRDRLATETLR